MEKKLLYTQRESKRAKRNRQRAKEKNKKLQALYDFLRHKHCVIAEEFEREYAETHGQADKEPLPTAVIPPHEHLPPNHSETLNTLSELDLGDINIDLLGDINIDLFEDINLDLLMEPYINS